MSPVADSASTCGFDDAGLRAEDVSNERRSNAIPIGDTPQVLVDRGLVTRQALDQAPVEMIFGPAHPLGARVVGIPCSELVYTRC